MLMTESAVLVATTNTNKSFVLRQAGDSDERVFWRVFPMEGDKPLGVLARKVAAYEWLSCDPDDIERDCRVTMIRGSVLPASVPVSAVSPFDFITVDAPPCDDLTLVRLSTSIKVNLPDLDQDEPMRLEDIWERVVATQPHIAKLAITETDLVRALKGWGWTEGETKTKRWYPPAAAMVA